MFAKIALSLISFLSLTTQALAQVEENADEIAVFADVCENLINDESKASARLRATDKASFKAVENITELREYKDKLPSPDFNMRVYKLVDNYLEDLKILITSQDDRQVCVEVSGYLPISAVDEVFGLVSVDEVQVLKLPPKPDITINEQIAYEEPDEEEIKPLAVAEDEPQPQKTTENKVKLLISDTEFYNGSSTNGFFPYLKELFAADKKLEVLSASDNPDYILKTKVLKAKVDNINSETSRLQIVVAVDFTDTKTDKTSTEHKNRFVLFNSTENAQEVASNLTKKLLAEGIEKFKPILAKSTSSGAIITPQ